MKTRYAILMLVLAGCNGIVDYSAGYENYAVTGPQFEWVEPVIFQQNLERCRTQTYCRAETIFD